MERVGSDKLPRRTPGVGNIQRTLRSIGMQVPQTGALDAATVAAINSIFAGWDDAPPRLRTGELTAAQIAANLPMVSRYLKLATSGAKSFDELDEG